MREHGVDGRQDRSTAQPPFYIYLKLYVTWSFLTILFTEIIVTAFFKKKMGNF